MNILIDIGHPAHVHLFKNLYSHLKNKEHKIYLTTKNMPVVTKLLDIYAIPFINLGIKSDKLRGKVLNQFRYDLALRKIVRQKKIDLGIGTSITLAHVSKITRMKSILLDDDDDQVQPLFVKFAHPFCDALLSPDSLKEKRKRKDTVYYPGFHELGYLHPDRFDPVPMVLKEIGVREGEPFFILRFNAFKAHHDIGVKGLDLEQKRKLVNKLSEAGKVFITTEAEIENEFKQYQLLVSPEKIHSLLTYATMFIGDSQTMTSEAAVLGTPAVKLNTFSGQLSVPNELENKYSLCFSYLPSDFKGMMEKVDELLAIRDLKSIWKNRLQKLLEDKMDVTSFLIWFVENFPKSKQIIKENPDVYQRFI